MCSTDKPKAPPIAPEAPTPAATGAYSAGARSKKNTRGGTLLTGPSGLSSDAPLARKTLLGG